MERIFEGADGKDYPVHVSCGTCMPVIMSGWSMAVVLWQLIEVNEVSV